MKLSKKLFALIIAIILISLENISVITAQDYKKTVINGTECYIYYVVQGEGFYSIGKKFGVTRDEVVKFNPSANKGLNRGQKLFIPIKGQNTLSANKRESIKTNQPLIHIVKHGESLFSISKLYNTTINNIKELNSLNSNSIGVGQTLIVGSKEDTKEETANNISVADNNITEPKEDNVIDNNKVIIDGVTYNTEKYIVKRKETLYSISQKFNTTVDAILACNPGIKSLSKDDILRIPMTKEVLDIVDEYSAENKQVILNDNNSSVDLTTNAKSNINIAVILPFKIKSPNNQSIIYSDYYKGILLSLDSLKNEGLNANVYTFDTNGEVETLNNILKRPEMKNIDIIFGSDKNEEISILGNFAKQNKTYLVNSFSVKNREFENNKYIIQGHIPSSFFFSATSNNLIKLTIDKEVVFLIDNNEPNDKQEFVDAVATGIKLSGREYKKFSFNEVADFEILLEALTEDKDIIFIASSSSRSGVAKSAAIASRIKESKPNIAVSLFGYPEWQTYIKDYLDTFHSLNTTIFTRFYTEPVKSNWKDFNRDFNYWFGDEKSSMIPAPHILGFDTGIYLIGGMLRHGTNFEQYLETISSQSLQTDFSFERFSDESGFVNKNLYFVTFTPEYKVVKEKIK